MPTLTLGDLLDHRDLGLSLVAGDLSTVRARSVLGAHSIETPHPAHWLAEEWVMLTTGVHLRTGVIEPCELIAEIDEQGLSALGFGVGLEFDDVPAELLEEARRRDFPVFSIPLPTPFRELTDFVNRSLLSGDLYTMRRLVSMQNFLMDALHEPEPRETVLGRLASLLQASVVLFTAHGSVMATVGRPPYQQIWSRIVGRGDGAMTFLVHGRSIVAMPVVTGGRTHGWLAVGVAAARRYAQVARPVVQAASRILGVISTAQRVATDERRALSAGLVRDLLASPSGDYALEARAAALGFTHGDPLHVAVIEPVGTLPRAALEGVLVRVEQWVRSRGCAHAATVDGKRIVVVVQGRSATLEEWADTAAADLSVRLASGSVVGSLDELGTSMREADTVMRHLASRSDPDAGSRTMRVEALDLADWLVAQCGEDVARRKAESMLAPLAENAPLRQSLTTYLDCGLNVNRAAKRLHVHPNSLRYRLRRIAELLGRSLDDPATLANLHLAMVIQALGPARPDGSDASGAPAAPASRVPPIASSDGCLA